MSYSDTPKPGTATIKLEGEIVSDDMMRLIGANLIDALFSLIDSEEKHRIESIVNIAIEKARNHASQ